MNNLSLRNKFWLLSGLFALVLISGALAVWSEGQAIAEKNQRLSDHEFPIFDRAYQVQLTVVQVQQWLTDISATRGQDGLDDGFKEAEEHARRFPQLVQELKQLDPGNSPLYEDLARKFAAYYAVGKRMAQAYVEQGPAGGNPMMPEFDKVAESLAAMVSPLVENARHATQELTAGQQEELSRGGVVLTVVSVATLAIVLVIIWILLSVLKSLPRIGEEVSKIANGDVGPSDFHCHRTDEFGVLAHGIEAMKNSLRELIERIAGSSAQVQGSSTKLAELTHLTQASMRVQLSEIDTVATAMNEMSASAVDVAERAKSAAGAAAKVSDESQDGKQAVDRTISSIRTLADNVEQAALVIADLEKKSDTIGGILEVIRGIAEQTNLLALNAAIEAARAGEQGRGFAVVADEVRTLASRTQNSTEEISEMITRLQLSARSAVEIMEKGRSFAGATVDEVHEAGARLDGIAASVQAITQLSSEIASAAQEQSAVSEDISRTITIISDATGDTTRNTADIAEATDQLAMLATDMQQLVSRFHT